jgi:aminoglycoside 6'-N-acetyltransferase
VILRGERLVARPIERGDVGELARIAAEPEVARWWGKVSDQELLAKADGAEGVVALALEFDGRLIGLIQYAEEPDPMYRHATVDLFLGAAWQGRGLGREAVGLVVRRLIDELGHHRVTIDPAAANERAIRCYAAAGFRAVGVMRRYERGPDGSFHDGLLMELVAEPPPQQFGGD